MVTGFRLVRPETCVDCRTSMRRGTLAIRLNDGRCTHLLTQTCQRAAQRRKERGG